MENLCEIIEALVFSFGDGIDKNDILEKLPQITKEELEKALNYLKSKYSGNSGVVLLSYNNKIQLATNPAYGDLVADCLLPVKERALSRTLLEVLGLIAYKQPVTKQELEEIKVNSASGSSSCDYSLSMLQKLGLVEAVGRKDAVGRPILFGTTDAFLRKFNLESLEDLPNYDVLIERIKVLNSDKASESTGLFKEVKVDENGQYVANDTTKDNAIEEETLGEDFGEEDSLDFLDGEEGVEVID